MRRSVLGLATWALFAGCGGGATTSPKCIAGDSKACTGPAACSGYQVCRADGTYDACNCGAGGTGGGTGGGGGAGGKGGSGGTGGPSCIAVAGRGGSGTPPDAGAGGTGNLAGQDAYVSDGRAADPQFQTFCAAVRATMVSRNERCFGYSQGQATAWVNIDPCGVWGTALDRGLMAFDDTNADACVAALQALSCGVDSPPAACNGVIRGLVADSVADAGTTSTCSPARQLSIYGDPLPAATQARRQLPPPFTLFTECMPGSFCTPMLRPIDPPLFLCQRFPGIGDACTAGALGGCAAGVCDHSGHCAAPKQVGESCTMDTDCVQGTTCFAGSTCAPKHSSGPCTSFYECLPPAICTSGACKPGKQVGDVCGPCRDPNGDACAAGLYCFPNGTCQRQPIPGEACPYEPPAPYVLCLIGQCDTTAGICRLRAANDVCGGDAPTSASCGPNAICNYGAPVCAPAWN